MVIIAHLLSIAGLVISIFVCARLLGVARRTKGAPELAMGAYLGFLVAAFFGYGGIHYFTGRDGAFAFPLAAGAYLMIGIGTLCLALGVWRIYRSADAWAGWVCGGLSAWVLVGWALTVSGDRLPVNDLPTWQNFVFVSGRVAIYAWAAWEGFRYYGMLRRRERLGLADHMLSHRVLLWACFAVCMGVTACAALVIGLTFGALSWEVRLLAVAGFNLAANYCLWFSFFPPAFYRRWISGDATGAQREAA